MRFLKWFFLGVCLTLFFVSTSFAIETKKEQLNALETILSEFHLHYAMTDFKKRNFQIDLEQIREKYVDLISNAMTLEEYNGFEVPQNRDVLTRDEFQQLMVGLSAEFKDGHVNIGKQSLNQWTLGIRASAIQEKLYVVGFREEFYIPGQTTLPLEVGDEIVSINGRSVQELAEEKKIYISSGKEKARYMKALESLVEHGGMFFRDEDEKKLVEITFKRVLSNGEEKWIKGQFHWLNQKGWIDFNVQADLYSYKPQKNESSKSDDDEKYYYGYNSKKTYFSQGLDSLSLPNG